MSAALSLLDEREVLIFDLDGTLVDSGPEIRATLDLALRDCGIAGVNEGDWVNLHSPLVNIVQDALTQRRVCATQVPAVLSAYGRRLARSGFELSAPYAGVQDFLSDRLRRGHRLAVCTNKGYAEAVRMLAHFGLLDFFHGVVGADSARAAKPDAAPLELLLQRLSAQPAQAVLVGDTHVDGQCAQNAGVAFLWHRLGYGDPALTADLAWADFDYWRALLPSRASGETQFRTANSVVMSSADHQGNGSSAEVGVPLIS